MQGFVRRIQHCYLRQDSHHRRDVPSLGGTRYTVLLHNSNTFYYIDIIIDELKYNMFLIK